MTEKQKQWYSENKERLKQVRKEYYLNTKTSPKILSEEEKEAKKIYQKAYREKTKEKRRVYNLEYQESNKEQIHLQRKEYRDENFETIKLINKANYEKDKENRLVKAKEYREKNAEEVKEKAKIWRKNNPDYRAKRDRERKLSDEKYRLSEIIRGAIRSSFKNRGSTKKGKTADILGCTTLEFKEYIESKFEVWMNWNNYGNKFVYSNMPNQYWDLDHIIQISTANTVEDLVRLNHYTNFQPLCSYTNRHIKRDIIEFENSSHNLCAQDSSEFRTS